MTADYCDRPWRVGRRVGRTIYAQLHDDRPSDSDQLIGVMDTPDLAARVVRDHNDTWREPRR